MLKFKAKAILFDLDGVLVDSLDAWFYVFNETLVHFGFKKISKKKFKEDFGAPIKCKKHGLKRNNNCIERDHQYSRTLEKNSR